MSSIRQTGARVACLCLITSSIPALCNAADMDGASDHPALPRVTGAELIGHADAPYDAGNFLVKNPDGKITLVGPEGARTRLLYANKDGDTPLMVQRNYRVALDELGSVEELYACSSDCVGHSLASTLWTRDTMIPTEGIKHPFYLLGFAHVFTNPTYRYAAVTGDSARYHVGVLSAIIGPGNANTEMRGRTVTLVEVIEEEGFQATLEFVDASEMRGAIGESGHIALYGIQFDTDKATLKAESQATVEEIVKVLQTDTSLHLYVVGHTDDVGALTYNRDLSERRAQAVVAALAEAGVPQNRLTPVGVGPAAPIGSNDSENGRALNRRVELVKRSVTR